MTNDTTIGTESGRPKQNKATLIVSKDEIVEYLGTKIKLLSKKELDAMCSSHVMEDLMYDLEDYINEELINDVWDYIERWIRDMKKDIAKKSQ